MVGAGLSCALGLPNTASLVSAVLDEYARVKKWRHSGGLSGMPTAFKFFYPDGGNKDFRPDAVDFFSMLKSYIETAEGLPGGLKDAPELYRSLKFAIARILIEGLRTCDQRLAKCNHEYLNKLVQPGNIVVTSNWDTAIERYAWHMKVPVRFSGYASGELVVLKLHGSVDWTLYRDGFAKADSDYAILSERLTQAQPYTAPLPATVKERREVAFRIRVLNNWSEAWRFLSSRTSEPHMVTMARGKAGDLGPLEAVWRDAYAAISRAKTLEIVGYSMPDDDIEIRTLLRAGVRRGSERPTILVRNPAPDVHDRARRFLEHRISSDYQPVNSLR
jgi:hypothetical protein